MLQFFSKLSKTILTSYHVSKHIFQFSCFYPCLKSFVASVKSLQPLVLFGFLWSPLCFSNLLKLYLEIKMSHGNQLTAVDERADPLRSLISPSVLYDGDFDVVSLLLGFWNQVNFVLSAPLCHQFNDSRCFISVLPPIGVEQLIQRKVNGSNELFVPVCLMHSVRAAFPGSCNSAVKPTSKAAALTFSQLFYSPQSTLCCL